MECLNPRYKQERFVFDDLRSPLPDVRFEVYDYSPGLFGEKAEPLGQCVLSLANHWKQTGGDVVDGPSRAEWHTLEPLVLGRRLGGGLSSVEPHKRGVRAARTLLRDRAVDLLQIPPAR